MAAELIYKKIDRVAEIKVNSETKYRIALRILFVHRKSLFLIQKKIL